MDEQTLNDLLECSVCLERLDTSSKVLPCQHTFCRKCLEDIVTSKQELRCPECRILVKMRVDDLPPNVLLMRILGGLKQEVPNKENATVAAAVTSPCLNPERVGYPPTTTHSTPVVKQRTPDAESPLPPPPTQQILARPMLSTPLPHKYLPQNVCHAKALFDFQSNITGDLAYKKGDVIVLRRRVDQNWFYGHLNGREGAFPVNHVQIIVPLPLPQCRAVFDFRMGPNDEEGCLSFAKGQIISVIRRVDQNWAEGRIGECIGIFPINFVEMNSLAKQLMGGGGDKETSGGRASLGEAMTTAVHAPTPGAAPGGTDATPNMIQRVVALPPMPTKVEAAPNYPVVRRAPPHTSPMQSIAARRHSAEILNPVVSGPPNVCVVAESNRKSTSALVGVGGESPRLLPYVAVFSYKPQKPDELELTKGAHYYVSDRCQDGWLRGMNSARKAGVFPGNHVIPLKEMPPVPAGVMSELSNSNTPQQNPRTSIPPPVNTPPTSPPALPTRNQASVLTHNTTDQPLVASPEAGVDHKREPSINLIKRITNNLKRAKSPPGTPEPEITRGPSATTITITPRSSQMSAQPRLLQSLHGRSGSCPSQLLDLSALKITPMSNANHNLTPTQGQGLPPGIDQLTAMSMFNSQRVRGQKERPALHSLHRQLGERKEDLTTLASSHKKSISLDAGRIISGPSSTSAADPNGNSTSGTRNSRTNGAAQVTAAGGHHHHHHQLKEKFRCIVPYPPNSDYELGLNVGDIVLVNKKRENGWYRGVHQRSGKSGLFPASFVEPAT